MGLGMARGGPFSTPAPASAYFLRVPEPAAASEAFYIYYFPTISWQPNKFMILVCDRCIWSPVIKGGGRGGLGGTMAPLDFFGIPFLHTVFFYKKKLYIKFISNDYTDFLFCFASTKQVQRRKIIKSITKLVTYFKIPINIKLKKNKIWIKISIEFLKNLIFLLKKFTIFNFLYLSPMHTYSPLRDSEHPGTAQKSNLNINICSPQCMPLG